VLVYVVAWRNGPIAEDELGVAGAPPGLRGRLSHAIDHMAAALRSIGTARTLSVAAGISGLVLVLQVVSFWLVMEAYHLSLSVWHGAAVLLILRLGTMLPGAPSNIGTYQFFTVLGLTLFGVDKTLATGFSVVVFLILTLPLWIIGGVACGRAGLDLRTIGASLRGAIGRSPGAPPGC